MATVTFNDLTGGVQMTDLNASSFLNYGHATWSKTQLKLFDTKESYSLFTGTGLTYKVESGKMTAVTGGTLSSLKIVYDGTTFISFTGLKVSAKKVGDAIFKGQSAVFLSTMLAGNDTVNGTKYMDILLGEAGSDTLNGNGGDDLLIGGTGADKNVGGSGFDIAAYFSAKSGLTANLAKPSVNSGDAKGDTYSSIEGLAGSSFADKLYGNDKANMLFGDAGNDLLDGGADDDILVGDEGADKLVGGSGKDTAAYMNASKGVVVSLSKPSINTNEAKGDTFSSIENLTGSSFADKLTGNGSANLLIGNGGADRLDGGAGNDEIYGGSGADDLYGGAGKDIFYYASILESTVSTTNQDTIFDFANGDKIDLEAIDANTKTTTKNDAFTFISSKGFSGKAGELRYEKKTSDTYIYGDLNGDKKIDFVIHLDDKITLDSGDFVL